LSDRRRAEVLRNLVYADEGDRSLAMDLYLPAAAELPPPVAVYFHGGGWAGGDRADFADQRLAPLARLGVAVASVSYRLTDTAVWPAQLHDAKGAVRWLRANALELGVDGARIGAWGASAGGHIASMLGLTAGISEFEGTTGGNLHRDSSVSAVVAWFATTDMVALRQHPPDPRLPLPSFLAGRSRDERPSFSARLLGVEDILEVPDAASRASPVSHAGRAAPPFLLVHGDRDALVPVEQSRLLHRALLASGNESTLLLLAGANHESGAFHHRAILAAVAEFLR
jgi:acetyl esterase/lipase